MQLCEVLLGYAKSMSIVDFSHMVLALGYKGLTEFVEYENEVIIFNELAFIVA